MSRPATSHTPTREADGLGTGPYIPHMLKLTPTQSMAFAIVQRAAMCGDYCPTNSEIAVAIGSCASSAVRVLNRLEAIGLVSIERGNSQRVITITQTGEKTAGEVRRPHWRIRPENSHRRHVRYEPNIRRTNAAVIADKMAAPRVERDPCPRCGARGDYACGHHASRLVTA